MTASKHRAHDAAAGNREREIERLRAWLERHDSPRLRMLLLVALTGGTGFLASWVMLREGVASMLVRYPIALGIAYGVFLLLLWTWLRTRSDHDHAHADVPDFTGVLPRHDSPASRIDTAGESVAQPVSAGSGHGAEGNWLDGIGSADEAAIPLLVIALVAALALASLWVVYAAPLLFAELMFDAALAAGFYRRLRRGEARGWLDTAVRHTFLPFLVTLVALLAFGFAAQHWRPDARSIGDLLQPATCDDCL